MNSHSTSPGVLGTYSSIPTGYRAVALEDGGGHWSWRAYILVREKGTGSPELVTLWNLPSKRVYLGCLLDDQNQVRQWLQIWVQNLEDLSASDAGLENQSSSTQMDLRWRLHWQAVRELSPAAIFFQWPAEQSRPLYLDAGKWRVVRPTLPQGSEWMLCQDDKELALAGLPKYSESLARHLRATDGAGAVRFVKADGQPSDSSAAVERSAELGFMPTWLAINPQGGPMAARAHPPLDFEDYLDLLGGATIAEVSARKHDCEATIFDSSLGAAGRDGRRHAFMLSGNDATELFYLKLRVLFQAGRAVLAHLRQQQCPLLNLDPSSFGISLGSAGELPWPWTTSCELLRPGRAFGFKIPDTDEVRFVAVGDSGATAYCPAGRSRRSDLMVTVQPVRVVVDETQTRVSMEGRLRLVSPEPVEISDIVRFRLSQGRIPGEFCGTIATEGPALRREIEFRTWPRAMAAADIAQVKRFEGGKIERCWCELIPALSSPYDSNSLSILGARALLVNENNPLPEVIDQLERLGRAASERLPADPGMEQTVEVVQQLMVEDKDLKCLAVHHLFGKIPDASKSPGVLPLQLWAEALAILLRLMPGLGNVSQCTDYGAAPGGGLHTPLEKPLEALENLYLRARSLVVSDWNANRELRAVLADLREAL